MPETGQSSKKENAPKHVHVLVLSKALKASPASSSSRISHVPFNIQAIILTISATLSAKQDTVSATKISAKRSAVSVS